MATTYVLISSTTFASNTASVTFSSIPQTYNDLVVRMSARNVGSGGVYVILNSDTTTKYSQTRLVAYDTTISGSRSTNQTYSFWYSGSNSTGTTANLFSNLEVYIPNYTTTNTKCFSLSSAAENNNTTGWSIDTDAYQYRGTSGISSIKITLADAPAELFATNSSFYLYGIKNS